MLSYAPNVSADGGIPPVSGVVVPLLQRLLWAKSVPRLAIEGLSFAHTDLSCPAIANKNGGDLGTSNRQVYLTCDDTYSMQSSIANDRGGRTEAAGELLYVHNCSDVMLRNISASHSGGHGISVDSCPRVTVSTMAFQ